MMPCHCVTCRRRREDAARPDGELAAALARLAKAGLVGPPVGTRRGD